MSAPPVVVLAALTLTLACGAAPVDDTAGDDASTAAAPASTTAAADPTTGTTTTTDLTTADLTAAESTAASTTLESTTADPTAAESTDTESDTDLYPEPDWPMGDPLDHDLTPDGLAHMAAVAEASDSNCLVVTRGGALVGEWYWNDFGPATAQANVYSITKSITSALVGIAIDRGELDLDAEAGFAEWSGTDSEPVRLRNLLSNDSGREWSFDKDYLQLGIAADQTQFALDLGHAHPVGSFWEYNNAAIQTLERALRDGTGVPADAYAAENLFNKIHMTATMGHDASGNPLTYQGVAASCRDLARFGYLYLRGGRWAGGEQVVPAGWVEQSLTPSTALNTGYGLLWWLNRAGHWVLPSTPLRVEGDGKLVPNAPEELFAAIGAFGQLVVVDPTTDSVWVRLGPTDLADAAGIGKLVDLWDAFAAAQAP